MTVGTTHTKQDFVGDGATTLFSVTFRLFEEAHIEWYEDGVKGALGVDFTVSVDSDFSGGDITATTAPASSDAIHIRRRVPRTQLVDFTNVEDFPAETVERAYDLAVMALQERQDPDFFSAPSAVTASTRLIVPHGLGIVPTRVRALLVCETAEHNYVATEEIIWAENNVVQAVNGGIIMLRDNTNINLIQGASLTILDKTAFTAAVITPANWKWRVEAWL